MRTRTSGGVGGAGVSPAPTRFAFQAQALARRDDPDLRSRVRADPPPTTTSARALARRALRIAAATPACQPRWPAFDFQRHDPRGTRSVAGRTRGPRGYRPARASHTAPVPPHATHANGQLQGPGGDRAP